MPYVMSRLVEEDGALIDQTSHWDTNFFSGQRFGPAFQVPVTFDLDTDVDGRRMPTLFSVPALVARREFCDVLMESGIDNVETYPARIRDPASGASDDSYVVLNIVGMAASADLKASEYAEIGPGLRMMDHVVLDPRRVPDARIFRLAEDPLQVIVVDEVYERVRAAGFDDVYFERLSIAE